MASRQVTVEPGRPDLDVSLRDARRRESLSLERHRRRCEGESSGVEQRGMVHRRAHEGVGSPVVVLSTQARTRSVCACSTLKQRTSLRSFPVTLWPSYSPRGCPCAAAKAFFCVPPWSMPTAFRCHMTRLEASGGPQTTAWSTQTGSFPTRPGVWNVTATSVAGNLSANGSVAVPADAAMLDIELDGDPMSLRADNRSRCALSSATHSVPQPL